MCAYDWLSGQYKTQTADRRLQTADSVQNADYRVQIADCRLQTEYKMQTKTKTVYLTINDIISITGKKKLRQLTSHRSDAR